MPVAPDLSIFGKNQSISDYQRANDEFAQRKALQQAQIMQAQAAVQKSLQPDIEDLGKRAFMKAATGQTISADERAALQYLDSKQQNYSIDPNSGRIVQKPSLLERAGIGTALRNDVSPPPATVTTPPPSNPSSKASILDLYGDENNAPGALPFVPPVKNDISPRTKQTLETEAVQSGRKRVDELISAASSAGAAKQASNTMASLLPNIGYTGTGGSIAAVVDKALTTLFGAPDIISGNPAAREAFQTQGVDAWVKAVEPLKGALTEREGGRFDLAVSNLDTTKEGIELRAKLTEALANRASEKSQFYQAYLSKNATLDGADAIWERYSNENPVITDELLGVNQKITGQSPIVSTQAQYDALPSGAAYIEVGVDGKPMKMRKP